MLLHTIQPRFSDTDALGHISNTAFPVWFEEARTPLFEMYHPTLDVKSWPLIIARIELDLLAQTYWGGDVDIKTYISKLGSSSCEVTHEAWQKDKMVAKGKAVMIYFDYENEKSVPIPEDIRAQLSVHLKME
ncbi:acyl-CoA thioesterase [Bermanella sp. WJH001]|uniref:acyl-CoA thioesterase n=1 Tax=Bermanella sp. WJH001 TaxID=3048005 RepID=UPI0024BE4517|nr:thioesterase family protein [Bermanella sp. WJH001]MDJ1539553.1 thioesterase family protein [Bermanella sp. WJH001]